MDHDSIIGMLIVSHDLHQRNNLSEALSYLAGGDHSMDEEGKWIVGHFWQRILGSDKQAGFIKSAEDPGYGSKL